MARMNTKMQVVLLATLFASSLAAHNLWVTAEGGTVRLVFEHAMEPGAGDYNDDIVSCGKLWARKADGRRTEIAFHKAGAGEKTYLEGQTTVTDAPRSLEFSCVFGIYKGRMDYFYGRFLDVSSSDAIGRLAEPDEHPIVIRPSVADGALTLEVVWQGKTLPRHRIAVVAPDGKEQRLETDGEGKLVVHPDAQGVWGFYAVRLDDEIQGEYKGEPYEGDMYATTLAIEWPLSR